MSSPKVALITGGASGIGRASCVRLAAKGYSIVIADIDAVNGRKVEDEIKGKGGKALFVPLDVVSEEQWTAAIEATVAAFGALHVLVNNAGINGPRVQIQDDSLAEFEKVMSITSTSVFLGCKAAAAELHRAGSRGSVVNVSSMYAIIGGTGTNAPYHAAKGAVRSITKNIAIAWAPHGVRCNSVHPGYIDTPLLRSAGGGSDERIAKLSAVTPLGRLGTMEEIANVIAFLASDESSFMTGSEMVCDGGYTAR